MAVLEGLTQSAAVHPTAKNDRMPKHLKRRLKMPAEPGVSDPWVEALEGLGLKQAMIDAAHWLAEHAIFRGSDLPAVENPDGYSVTESWDGVCREYSATSGKWYVFGPLWHTGQAAKALAMAYRIYPDAKLLQAAKAAAGFLLRMRIDDPDDPDYGLIVAHENGDPTVSATSCMLESLGGLIELGDLLEDRRFHEAAIDAVRWAMERMFLPEEGLFVDDFVVSSRTVRPAPTTLRMGVPGRPLLDDGVLVWAYEQTGDEAFAKTFRALADRLLADEYPSGNWIAYPPCHPGVGAIHPRHGYWWGRPMIAVWRTTEDQRFLDCARRTADWYVKAQRLDGGLFRTTTVDFSTTAFGQATSGVLAAACLWQDLIELGYEEYRTPLNKAIAFGQRMQMRQSDDPNIRGAILEKVVDPDGSGQSPYLFRDLASIFFVQAAAAALPGIEESLE